MRQALVVTEADLQRIAWEVAERRLTPEELVRVIAALTGSTRLRRLLAEAVQVVTESA